MRGLLSAARGLSTQGAARVIDDVVQDTHAFSAPIVYTLEERYTQSQKRGEGEDAGRRMTLGSPCSRGIDHQTSYIRRIHWGKNNTMITI